MGSITWNNQTAHKYGRFYKMILMRVISWELESAVQNDEELNNILPCLTIAQGRMLSNIH